MKLPVFFHIPKNAGTYITSTSYYAAHELSNGNKYYVDVVKGNITFYRLICFDQGDLNNKYKKVNSDRYQVNFEDLDLSDLKLIMIRICDAGFGCYHEDIYSSLPIDVQPYEFICLREPYDRILSLYSYIQSAQSSKEPTHRAFGKNSFIEYLNSSQLEGSWLIRNLLNIPNEVSVDQEHFNNTCKLLDNMYVFTTSNVNDSVVKVFEDCYDFKFNTIQYRNVVRNQTQNKLNVSFDSLDMQSKTAFLNHTSWDRQIYERYKDADIT